MCTYNNSNYAANGFVDVEVITFLLCRTERNIQWVIILVSTKCDSFCVMLYDFVFFQCIQRYLQRGI